MRGSDSCIVDSIWFLARLQTRALAIRLSQQDGVDFGGAGRSRLLSSVAFAFCALALVTPQCGFTLFGDRPSANGHV
eukprot:359793-Chlamydomonas_euryale.AAC.27